MELCKVFGLVPSLSWGLLNLRQGQRPVADYAIDFHTQASQSGWNPTAQVDALMQGLSVYIKDELGTHEVPSSLDVLIGLAVHIDLWVLNRCRERRHATQVFEPTTI